MAFIIKTAKTIRNHWKKSTFAAIALSYGYSYAKGRFETQELMRVYCEKAAKYGDVTIPVDVEPRNITVILNPSANTRKASDEFEKYCAPILHLAGICVIVMKTETEGHARTLINDLSNTDAVVVAGGDGTLSEVVTGLLRRTRENTNGLIPIGILPLGRTNTAAGFLFPTGRHLARVRALADATMAIVEDVVKPINVLKVEVVESETKPIYAVCGIKWGAYRDAETKKDSYWVYGNLRKYATYLFNGYKNSLTWNCTALLSYTPPCKGCSNCTRNETTQKRWFQKLSKENRPKYLHEVNPECELVQQKNISTVDFTLAIPPFQSSEEIVGVVVSVGPQRVDYLDFVKEGWRSENGEKRTVKEVIEARTVEIQPNLEKGNNQTWFSIDNENYELKPIRVTLLPRLINVFCKKETL